MKVRDIMVAKVKSVLPETSVGEGWDLLSENEISGLPVIDKGGKLVGMFTEKDILRYILPGYLKSVGMFVYEDNPKAIKNKARELLAQCKVSDIMRKEVVTISPDASLSEAARVVLMEKIRRLPVVDKEGKVVGIIARQDIVKAFIRGQI